MCHMKVAGSCRNNWRRMYVIYLDPQPPRQWSRASSFLRFLDHTQRRAKVGRTPLDEWSVRRRNLYLTNHKTQQTNIHDLVGIRTCSPKKRAAADPRLRPSGHSDRQWCILQCEIPSKIGLLLYCVQVILIAALTAVLCLGLDCAYRANGTFDMKCV
jgi:hypothetical protein